VCILPPGEISGSLRSRGLSLSTLCWCLCRWVVISGATVMRPGDDTPDDQAPDDAPRAPGALLGGEGGVRPHQNTGFRLKQVSLHSQQPGGGAAGAQRGGQDMVAGPSHHVPPPQHPHPVVATGSGRCPLRAGNCDNCGETSSPQWRRGPPSKPSLCNACGCRYKQSGETGLARISNRLAPGYVARSPQQPAAPPVKPDDGMPPPPPPPPPPVDVAMHQPEDGDDAVLPPSSLPPAPAPAPQQQAAPAAPPGGAVWQGAGPPAARERPPSRFASQGAVAATAAHTGAPPRGQWMRGAPGELYTADVFPNAAAPAAGGSAPESFTSSLQAAVAAGALEQQRMGWNTQHTRPSVPGSGNSGAEYGFGGGQPRAQQAPKRKEGGGGGGGGGGRMNQLSQLNAAAPPRVYNLPKKRDSSADAIPRGPEDLAAVAAEHGAMSLLPAPLPPDAVRCDCANCEMPKLRKRCLRLLAAEGHMGADVALGGAASCGLDVEVLWPRDDAFYLARILSYDPASRTHVLRYFIDGQRETRRLWTDILQWPTGTGAVSSMLKEQQWTEGGAAAHRTDPMRHPPVGWLTVRRHRALAEAATAEAVRSGTWTGSAPATAQQVTFRDAPAAGYDAPPQAKRPRYVAPSEQAAGAPGGGGDVDMGDADGDNGSPGQLRSGRNMPPLFPSVVPERVRAHKSAPAVPLTEEETRVLRGYVLSMQRASSAPPFEYWRALRRFSNKGLSRLEMQKEAQGKLHGTCRGLHAQLMELINAGNNGFKVSLAAMLVPLTESKEACQQLMAEARASMPAEEEEVAAAAPAAEETAAPVEAAAPVAEPPAAEDGAV
jgi:hypothetical protein